MTKPVLFCILWSLVTVIGATQSFSEHTRVSLLTCSAGEELYARFGHSAIRVQDSLSGQDIVFNYGIFDFDTPNFYGKFIRGKLLYRLAVHSTGDFLEVYRQENREVSEQEIYLTTEQTKHVLQFLEINYRPENRYYLYDFFFDNCSTRIRDVLYRELEGQLQLPVEEHTGYTFREMLDLKLRAHPWPKFGMDFLLGSPADRLAGFSDEMFLPDFLSDNLGSVRVARADTSYALMALASILVEPEALWPEEPPFWSPLLATSLLLGCIVLFTLLADVRIQRLFDRIFFILLGLAGAFLLFMWWGTDHAVTKNNWNLLWLHPLYMLWPFVKEKTKRWMGLAQVAVLLLLLVSWGQMPQAFHVAFVPLWLAIGVRCGREWTGGRMEEWRSGG